MEMSDQHHAPAALAQGTQSQYPLYGRLDEPESRSERYGEEKKSLALTENRVPNPRPSSP
jgi:hypothetical protein